LLEEQISDMWNRFLQPFALIFYRYFQLLLDSLKVVINRAIERHWLDSGFHHIQEPFEVRQIMVPLGRVLQYFPDELSNFALDLKHIGKVILPKLLQDSNKPGLVVLALGP
jgi:hypothetical protein